MVYFWIAILFVIGMIMIAKPELIWKIDHAFTVKNGEPAEFSIALVRVGGTLILILGIAYLLLSVTDFIKNAEPPVNSENTDAASDAEIPKETEKNEISADFSFADLKNIEFWFGSGAGAWRTVLMIEEDGSFSGEYSDSNVVEIYRCEFSGKFTEPVKVNDYTYSMQIEEISYQNEAGTEEIKDGVLYKYTEPYGLEDAENILIYLPGTPVKDIPEDCRKWIKGRFDSLEGMETLTFYALNNEAHQNGFSSYNIIVNDIDSEFRRIDHLSDRVEEVLGRGTLTQEEYDIQAEKLYQMWEEFMNQLLDALKETKDSEFMEILTVEQREWVEEKEKAIAEAGAGVTDDSKQSQLMNLKGMELTKERVCELMEFLEE